MKYQLLKVDYGFETATNQDGNYSITATLGLKHLMGLEAGIGFSKDITITSNNDQTGHEVDYQRELAIAAFCTENEIENIT